MNRVIILIMIIAIATAFFQQVSAEKNVYIQVVAFVVFMFGMMRLSANTPSKNKDKEGKDV